MKSLLLLCGVLLSGESLNRHHPMLQTLTRKSEPTGGRMVSLEEPNADGNLHKAAFRSSAYN